MLPPGEKRNPVVVAGEGTRALVLSVSREAYELGIRPGQRAETIDTNQVLLVHADPAGKNNIKGDDCLVPPKYEYETEELCEALGDVLPGPEQPGIYSDDEFLSFPVPLRAGVFAASWSLGTSYLEIAINRANQILHLRGFEGAWGIAPEMGAAEIAAQIINPGEMKVVKREEIKDFLSPLPIEVLYDLGNRYCEVLHQMGVSTLGELASLPVLLLRELFGKDGIHLRTLALTGKRPDPPREWRGRRRLAGDEDDPQVVRSILAALVSEGMDALSNISREPGSLHLLIIYSDGKRTGGRIGSGEIANEGYLQQAAADLLDELWQRRVRLAELRITIPHGQQPSHQLGFFTPAYRIGREERIQKALSSLRTRWGRGSVNFASAVG